MRITITPSIVIVLQVEDVCDYTPLYSAILWVPYKPTAKIFRWSNDII